MKKKFPKRFKENHDYDLRIFVYTYKKVIS